MIISIHQKRQTNFKIMGQGYEHIGYYCYQCKEKKIYRGDVFYFADELFPLGIITEIPPHNYRSLTKMNHKLSVIHIVCSHCKNILSTLGDPKELKKI